MVDLDCEGKEVDLDTLEYIHLHKTGALLKACVTCGALIGGADEKLLEALRVYAKGIGLAFQIIDDILDVTASSDVLGKTAGKDLIADKTTYPKLLGLEESRERAKQLIKQAKAAINALRGFKLRERYLIVQPYNPLTMKEKVEKQIERRREQVSNSKKSNGNAKKQRVS